MNFVKNIDWVLVYDCGFHASLLFTMLAKGISIFFIRPRPRLLSAFWDLLQISSMNGLFWPFHLIQIIHTLSYAIRYRDYRYLVPLLRLNPETYAVRYGLLPQHLVVSPNFYTHDQNVYIWRFFSIFDVCGVTLTCC